MELTAELLVDDVRPVRPVISPDGRRVAYLITRWNDDDRPRRFAELWVSPVDPELAARRLATDLRGASALRWTAGSDALLYISRRQIQRISTAEAEASAAAEPETLTSWQGGISDQLPLADGRTVAVVAADEPTEEAERRDAEGDDAMVWGRHVDPDRLHLLDLETGSLKLVEALGDRHIIAMSERPGGGALAVVSWADPLDDPGAYTARLHVLDLETGKAADLGPAGLEAGSPAWWKAADGWHVAYIAIPLGARAGFAAFDIPLSSADAAVNTSTATATANLHRNLTAELEACPNELVQTASGSLLALFAEGLDTAVYRLDPDTMRFEKTLHEQGRLDTLTASDSGSVIAARKSTAYEPRNIFVGPADGTAHGPFVRLTDTQPAFRQGGVAWGRRERLEYRAADGLRIEALLIVPPGRSRQDGPFPMVTWIHGGPYSRHVDELALVELPSPQLLAAAGFAVFLPNPRGSEGRGHDFAMLAPGAVGEGEWTDVLTGIDLLIEQGVADPDRLGIGGWSHGGFTAAWAVGQTDRFKAALMGAGISDWGIQVALGELGVQDGELAGSLGWEGPGPHRHDELSPISYASRVRTPVLILHGEEDQNVPLAQAIYFHRALRHHGVEHELVVYPREPHGIWERTHQLDVMRRGVAWFERWLRP